MLQTAFSTSPALFFSPRCSASNRLNPILFSKRRRCWHFCRTRPRTFSSGTSSLFLATKWFWNLLGKLFNNCLVVEKIARGNLKSYTVCYHLLLHSSGSKYGEWCVYFSRDSEDIWFYFGGTNIQLVFLYFRIQLLLIYLLQFLLLFLIYFRVIDFAYSLYLYTFLIIP